MKYYYDNLPDALQAMQHGVKLEIYLTDAIESLSLDFEYLPINKDVNNDFDTVIMQDFLNLKRKFFIKKESEHLLEPQRGDLGISWDDLLKFDGNIWRDMEGNIANTTTTISRNDMYFPEPKILEG